MGSVHQPESLLLVVKKNLEFSPKVKFEESGCMVHFSVILHIKEYILDLEPKNLY